MNDHTDLQHAKMIAHLMPVRELMVGDKVIDYACGKVGIVIEEEINRTFDVFYHEEKMHVFAEPKDLTRLYTFTEIWAELPEGCRLYHGTEGTEAWTDDANGPIIICTNPANAAAELLKWVRER